MFKNKLLTALAFISVATVTMSIANDAMAIRVNGSRCTDGGTIEDCLDNFIYWLLYGE